MQDKEARQKLLKIFGSQIKLNKDFGSYVEKLKENMVNDLIEWCERCKDNKELGSVPKKKEFKNLYIFFRKIGSNIRVTLIKEQNQNFIEIRLEDHKCYDDIRIRLGYKRSSYYSS